MPVDLLAFNGVINNQDNDTIPSERSMAAPAINPLPDSNTDPGSLERGESQVAANARLLFASDLGVEATADEAAPVFDTNDQHNFSYQIVETFGQTNVDYLANGGGERYSWLTWNNRPYVSQYELMNVPFSSPSDLPWHFSIKSTTINPYIDNPTMTVPARSGSARLGSTFGHLLNFYGHAEGTNPQASNFYRLLDYTEVPSRYVGTEKWLNPGVFANNPFDSLSHYRYPGKININTVQEEVFNAMMGDYSSGLEYLGADEFDESRWQQTGTMFFKPYRNSMEGNLVPVGVPLTENVDCGLFRRADTSDDESIFDFDSTGVMPVALQTARNADRNAYFKNAIRQRLGNIATTRSSVFAIWVTVGYFEVNTDGTLKLDPFSTPPNQGIEVGADTGEIKRNRGFVIFDRSVPMAFEPGKNHNVERGILVKSIIE